MPSFALISQILDALGDEVVGHTLLSTHLNQTVGHISTDTRTIRPQDVFLALEGERFDGHQFIAQAITSGAIATITRQGVITADIPRIEVKDTLVAYQAIGRWWRQQLGLPVVAITGSVGKTTTKELISAALGLHGSVHKTRANFNNEIGVPKTLLELTSDHDYAVVEMGMRGPGQIALLAQIAQPNVSVITNVGTAHIGLLGSEQAIADAKCELLTHMPADGTAVLNHDNARLMDTAARVWSGNTITYGLMGGDVHGHFQGNTVVVDDIELPLPLEGQHNALNYLSAIATLQALNLDWRGLALGLTVDMPAGRAKRYELKNDIVLLDETYNAGAESMKAALRLLKDQPGQRHIAVLGTMKELGHKSVELHQTIGTVVQSLGLDHLFILADPAEANAMAMGAGDVPHQKFTHHTDLAQHLKQFIQPGDRLLFKASRSVAMDKVVEPLLE
ncbi:udp-n-acetylmuramoyl-tripeptide--d-alanyl-d-alanine ligase [Leptolyngbya sp. Heron Island J]|uniref:UDP-N-acetylmuramoyl-tripeptide--D-alanyl-D- alanine ligase n=1 Tax=Leptolyngbya sp. Heron Island J TaxID=1385935 RepID=UPI0003B9B48B|nr:UDP-N-acetylmuramoyl-tripeptide--D-alanyl-D-alanine ligase [Leptolyngbya sp. Heron Island J]ESA35909.1 udp-n-acetylmuramoyl-tripeptide--d-alanyl-d-alanine ligase [Leptolyngbya sp. Heron Island J]